MVDARQPTNIVYRGELNHVEFILATGDLFDADVDAIVNSEQTDFILSGNLQSVSGQIYKRYGATIQRELDAVCNALGGYGERVCSRSDKRCHRDRR